MRSRGPRYHSNRTPEDDQDTNERDVIMGRGKRVSEWPGNIYFRQVVNEHRDAYLLAFRTTKVTIALDVIDKIHKNGGRFMTETPDQRWVEVSQDRAIEKCCQALREKEKPNPPEGDPFVPVAKKKSSSKKSSSSRTATKASRGKTVPKNSGKAKSAGRRKTPASSRSSTSKKRKKVSGKRSRIEEEDSDASDDSSSSSGEDDSSSEEESGSSDDDSSSGSSNSSDGSSIVRLRKKQKIAQQSARKKAASSAAVAAAAAAASKKDSKKNGNKKKADDKDKGATPSLMDSPVNRVRFSQHGEMIKRLESFVKVAGHCAVPPDWESDPLLADWCTLQRQNYRNRQTEYVDPKEIDESTKDLVKHLEKLNFVWDYDSWHWQYQFDKFIESYNKKDDSSQGVVENVEWLEDQRRQWVENKANLTSERIEKLKEAGISLA